MPVYEEKLISPLAIRFIQDHIRHTFRDGRFIMDTLEQITAEPSTVEGYDVILRAPFPTIEILRWCPHQGDFDARTEHWYTLDNRRLYCLQRAAVAHWPKRVATVVEILYTDHGRMRRKYDSVTRGMAVTIAEHLDSPMLERWDWREKVLPLEVRHVNQPPAFLDCIIRDDSTRDVDCLLDLVEPSSSLAVLAAAAPEKQGERRPQSVSDEPAVAPKATVESAQSTTDESGEEESASDAERGSLARVRQLLEGTWSGNVGGKWYEVEYIGDVSWSVTRQHSQDMKRFTIWFDADQELVWWGTDYKYFLYVSELQEGETLKWYASHDEGSHRPSFVWCREGPPSEGVAPTAGASAGANQRRASGTSRKYQAAVEEQRATRSRRTAVRPVEAGGTVVVKDHRDGFARRWKPIGSA